MWEHNEKNILNPTEKLLKIIREETENSHDDNAGNQNTNRGKKIIRSQQLDLFSSLDEKQDD